MKSVWRVPFIRLLWLGSTFFSQLIRFLPQGPDHLDPFLIASAICALKNEKFWPRRFRQMHFFTIKLHGCSDWQFFLWLIFCLLLWNAFSFILDLLVYSILHLANYLACSCELPMYSCRFTSTSKVLYFSLNLRLLRRRKRNLIRKIRKGRGHRQLGMPLPTIRLRQWEVR